jgi:hypothetical protein
MAINWARGGLFAGGILVGAVLAGALFTQGRDERGDTAAAPPAAALQQTAVVNNSRRIDCSFAPIVTPAGKEDGLLPLDKDLQGNSPSAVATLILSGKEAAAAGRPRDAETAFLMACRSGEEVKNDPIPLADAQYQLGRHYAQVAAPPDAPKRQELLKRAEALYASSLQVYLKHRGASHEKTRFAQEGLDALQRLTAPAPIVAAPNAEERRMAEATKVVGNAPQPAPAASAPAAAPPVVAAPAAVKPAAPTAKAPVPTKPAPQAQARSTEREKPAPVQRPSAERDEPAQSTTAPEPETPARTQARRSAPPPERVESAPEPVPPVRVTRPEPLPAPAPVTRSRPAPEPTPMTRAEPEPAPRVVVPAPVAREPEFVPPPPPPAGSLGGPPATASGGTDVPTE